MLPIEQQRFEENFFQNRRSSTIKHYTSGHASYFASRSGQGFVPGQSGQDLNDEHYRDGLKNAMGYVEIVISELPENDSRVDQLREVLSAINSLSQIGPDSVERAKVNRGDGTTEPRRFVPSNTVSRGGPEKPKGGPGMPAERLSKDQVFETKMQGLRGAMNHLTAIRA